MRRPETLCMLSCTANTCTKVVRPRLNLRDAVQSWSDVYYFCSDARFCTCDFKWTFVGYFKFLVSDTCILRPVDTRQERLGAPCVACFRLYLCMHISVLLGPSVHPVHACMHTHGYCASAATRFGSVARNVSCVQALWNFILSAALGIQKLVVDFCLDGLLPGEGCMSA
jgi:hypothetical protein